MTRPALSSVVYPKQRGDFIGTYSGRKFYPLDPNPADIDIVDIAHSLSMQCRYAGHCRRFYSVAEHSVLLAEWMLGVAPEHALWALLHDASEAYLVDVPRPLKHSMPDYLAAERQVMRAVCKRFSLPEAMPALVHEADQDIIADELANMEYMPWHDKHDDPLGVTLRYWGPSTAKEVFLDMYDTLISMRAKEAA